MAFVAVLARLDVANCKSRLQREVATPVAGKIVSTIIVNSAINGVTRRGAVSGTVLRFSIIRVLAYIVVAAGFVVAPALLVAAVAESPITASYGIQVAKSCCSSPQRFGRGIGARNPTQVGRDVGYNILQLYAASCPNCGFHEAPCKA